jgi:2,4-dienoyl-CoA reductase-like NADH-dependent reductase (Old Yellow Enzyme family)
MPFPNLLSPIQIGSLEVRYRIVFPPIGLALHDPTKAVHPHYVAFIHNLVKDHGVGMVISEFTSVANDQFWAPASRFDSDRFIPEFASLARTIKSQGVRLKNED